MLSRYSALALMLLFTFGLTSHAGKPPPATCESDLVSAFQRAPNDSITYGSRGLVTDQVRITVPTLFAGYRRGLFAYADETGMGRWYNPPTRGILMLKKKVEETGELKTVGFGRRNDRWLDQKINSGEWRITRNQAFERVVRACADAPRPHGWITETHIREYTKLHEAGYARSIEVWEGDNLIGGLYVVSVGGIVSGESMFQKSSNAMKAAYRALIHDLVELGHEALDAQMNIGLTATLGGKEIPRYQYMALLRKTQLEYRSY